MVPLALPFPPSPIKPTQWYKLASDRLSPTTSTITCPLMGPPYSLITWSALIVLRFRRCNRNHQNCLGGWLNRNHLVFTNHRPMTHHPEGQSPPHLLPEEHLMTHQFFPYLFPIFLSYNHHQLKDGKEFRSRIPSHDPSSTPTEFPQ